MIEILVDAPGAGDWIMEQAGGHYVPYYSHSISTHQNGQLLGGFVLTDYIRRGSAMVSMAGEGQWCPRNLLVYFFKYAFEELDLPKLFALIRSDNSNSIQLCMRVGWKLETTVLDVWPDGVHGVLLYMYKRDCRWLTYRKSLFEADAA